MIQAGIHPSPSRSEADVTGGGKGALTQIDLSATLATNNDQYLFQPIENHAQDGRYVLREDGVIQTLMARMGTGGECASDPPVLFREERRGSFVGDKVSSTVLVCNSKDVILFQRKEGPPP